jgi:hypothetical protein
MTPLVTARWDAALSARVVRRTPLLYAAGADPAEDRPAYVRAGSGLTFFAGKLAVVQDDARFVALVDPSTLRVDSVALPANPSGERLFDEGRGNKSEKLDLEACLTLELDGVETLLAFGSGSSPRRERVALVRMESNGAATTRVVSVPALYAMLRERRDFSGSELNLEGAAVLGERVWLVQRGNGAPRDGRRPRNALGAIPLSALRAIVDGAVAVHDLEDVTEYDLGSASAVPFTFTDVAVAPNGALAYLAAAEDSPDAVRDGSVVGTALGTIAAGRARCTALRAEDGTPFLEKAEGLTLDPRNPRKAYIVVDPDDFTRPCDLCELLLEGPWW